MKTTKITKKKTGRKPVDIEDYFTKIMPYLQLGLSLHKSCDQADIPYTTVVDYYHSDESFRRRVDKAIRSPVVMSRAKLVKEAQEKDWGKTDAHKYILDNLDEDIKRKGDINISGEKVLVIPGELMKKYKIEGTEED